MPIGVHVNGTISGLKFVSKSTVNMEMLFVVTRIDARIRLRMAHRSAMARESGNASGFRTVSMR